MKTLRALADALNNLAYAACCLLAALFFAAIAVFCAFLVYGLLFSSSAPAATPTWFLANSGQCVPLSLLAAASPGVGPLATPEDWYRYVQMAEAPSAVAIAFGPSSWDATVWVFTLSRAACVQFNQAMSQ